MEIVFNREDYDAACRHQLLSSQGRHEEAAALWRLTGVPLPPASVVSLWHCHIARFQRPESITIIEEVQIAENRAVTCTKTEVVPLDPRELLIHQFAD